MDGYFWGIVFFIILQVIAAILRVYVRAFIVRKFGPDDIAMLITLILATAYDACILNVSSLTHDRPVDQIPFQNLNPAVHSLVAGETLYIVAAAFLKISLGLLLLRVLVKTWQKWTIYCTIIVCCLYASGYFFVALFACGNPRDYLINALERHCISNPAINGTSYAHAVMNAIADIVFASLPVALLWNADMSRRSKISVGCILVLGSVGCIFTLVRIGFVHYLSAVSATYFVTGRPIALTSSGELSIGIVCICLATYKPLVHRFWYKDDYYTNNSVTDAGAPETAQNNASWSRQSWTRQSWNKPSRTPSRTQGRSSTSEQPVRYGPEYRTEFKTLNAHVEESHSGEIPMTPASDSTGWPTAASHTGPFHDKHRFSEVSDSMSYPRSPV